MNNTDRKNRSIVAVLLVFMMLISVTGCDLMNTNVEPPQEANITSLAEYNEDDIINLFKTYGIPDYEIRYIFSDDQDHSFDTPYKLYLNDKEISITDKFLYHSGDHITVVYYKFDKSCYEPDPDKAGEIVIVENVIGYDEYNGITVLVDQGFNVEVKYCETTDYPHKTVISQSVEKGVEYTTGKTIVITVAKAPLLEEIEPTLLYGQWETIIELYEGFFYEYYEFREDGTCNKKSVFYEKADGSSENDVYEAGTVIEENCTYAIDGQRIIVYYDMTEYYEVEPGEVVIEDVVWEVHTIGGGVMTLSELSFGTNYYFKSAGGDFKKLCEDCGVDYDNVLLE